MIEPKTVRRFPAWASASILLLALVAGAGIVYWFFTTGPGGTEVVVLDRGPEDGVKAIAAGRSWRVQSGNTGMRILKGPGSEFQTKFYYLTYDFLTPDEFAVLNKGRRLVADTAMSESIGLSTGQIETLKEQVKRGFDIGIADADRTRLLDLFRAWLDAPESARSGKELPLLVAVDDIGQRTSGSARQVSADAVAKIQSIVTPEQWQRFDKTE